jgi:hypothetical protein
MSSRKWSGTSLNMSLIFIVWWAGVAGGMISVGENMDPAWVGRSESFAGSWGGCAAPVRDLDY